MFYLISIKKLIKRLLQKNTDSHNISEKCTVAQCITISTLDILPSHGVYLYKQFLFPNRTDRRLPLINNPSFKRLSHSSS